VADVLSYVEYDAKEVFTRFRDKAEAAVRRGDISVQERKLIVDAFDASMRGYTYFER
jgi:arginine decarboxylase